MAKALIVYASFTGNTEAIVNILSDSLKELKVEVEMSECTQVSPMAFQDFDICIVGTYTWGRDGELPDEFYEFYEALPSVDLAGKVFGVLGSGDTLYDEFCKSVNDFDKQFEATKAKRGAAVVKVDDYPKDKDIERIAKFAESLVRTYKAGKQGLV